MAHEEKVDKRFIIDLELTIDTRACGRERQLADTASYSAIVETVTHAFTRQGYRLVEARLPASPMRCSRRPEDHLRAGDGHSGPTAPDRAIFNDVGVRSCASAMTQHGRCAARDSAAMWAMCATHSTAPSRSCATAATCA